VEAVISAILKIDSFDFDACSRELAVEFMKM